MHRKKVLKTSFQSSLVDYEDSDSDDENETEKARSAPASVLSSPRSSDILQERG